MPKHTNPNQASMYIHQISTAPRSSRWQVAPATLSIAVGVILVAVNIVHIHDVMIGEIRRALQLGDIIRAMIRVLASSFWFGSAICAFIGARLWMRNRIVDACIAEFLALPLFFICGVVFLYS
jgi:hypothetical protein